jgi:Uma2 family endonuclease
MQTEEEISIDMPSFNHSLVQSYLAAAFRVKYRNEYDPLSQPSLLLGDWLNIPDLAIFPKRVINWQLDEITITEVPTTIIEIISPKQGGQDLMEKFVKYFKAGVKSCWLVNPFQEIVQVFTPDWKKQSFTKKGDQIHDPSLNITIDFEEVFS